jgi:hypothetical protein
MARIEVELSDDLEAWVRASAQGYGLTPAQMLEHLAILESGLQRTDPLGRAIRFRDTVYRQLTPPAAPQTAAS